MADRDEAGRLLPGNKLWQMRDTCGPKHRFDSPDALWNACVKYFEWVDANPLMEGFQYQGQVSDTGIPKMRAMTIGALCVFLGINRGTWNEWRKSRPDLSEVIEYVEEVIFAQKFEGASAGLLNANIISRDLGLTDRQEVTGKDGKDLIPEQMTETEVARRVAFLLMKGSQT